MKRINFKLILLTQLAIVLVAGAVYFIHSWQIRRNTQAMLGRAVEHYDAAQNAKDAKRRREQLREAAKAARNYLSLNANNLRAWELYADSLYERQGATQRVFRAYEELLRRATATATQEPDTGDSTSSQSTLRKNPLEHRRRIVDVAVELARDGYANLLVDAKSHILDFGLLEESPNDGELRYYLGLCQEYARTFTTEGDEETAEPRDLGADYWYAQAIELAPDHVDSYVRLTHVQRNELENVSDAEATIERLSKVDRFEAHLRRSQYYYLTRGSGPDRLDRAAKAAIQAVNSAPPYPNDEEVDPFLLLADIAHAHTAQLLDNQPGTESTAAQTDEAFESLSEEAQKIIEIALPKQANNPGAYLALASLELARIDDSATENALKWLNQGIESIDATALSKAAKKDEIASQQFERYLDLVWTRADVLISSGKTQEAQETIVDLEALHAEQQANITSRDSVQAADEWANQAVAQRQYLTARIEANDGAWNDAATTLEGVWPELDDRPDLARQANMLLAQCYAKLFQPNKQLEPYRRILRDDPTDIAARFELSRCLINLGRLDEALAECEQAMVLQGNRPSRRIVNELARLRSLRIMQQPEPDWSPVTDLFRRFDKDSQNAEVALAAARAFVLAGNTAEAAEWLQSAFERHGDRADVAAALASLHMRQGEKDKARDLLAETENRLGDHVELRLAWAEFALAELDQRPDDGQQQTQEQTDQQKEAIRNKLESLAADLDKFEPADRLKLLRGLARAAGDDEQLNLSQQARDFWGRVIEMDPSDSTAHLERFELDRARFEQAEYAASKLDVREAEKQQQRLLLNLDEDVQGIHSLERRRAVGEPPFGPLGRYAMAAKSLDSARAAVRAAKTAQSPLEQAGIHEAQIEQAKVYADEALDMLPGWADLVRLKADLLALQARLLRGRSTERAALETAALEQYQQALRLGEDDPSAFLATAVLLHKKGRFEDANDMMRRVAAGRSEISPVEARFWTLTRIGAGKAGETSAQWQAEFAKSEEPVDQLLIGFLGGTADNDGNTGKNAPFEKACTLAAERYQKALVGGAEEIEEATEKLYLTWITYIVHLIETPDLDKAINKLREAEGILPGDEAPSYLATCWQLLHRQAEQSGDTETAELAFDEAEQLLNQALAERPDDAPIRKQIAALYARNVRGDSGAPHPAIPHLQKLLESNPDDARWARRNLARLKAQTGSREDAGESLRLIEDNLPADIRTRLQKAVDETARRSQVPVQILEGLLSEIGDSPTDLHRVVRDAINQDQDYETEFRTIAMLHAARFYPRLSPGSDRFLLAQLYRHSGQDAKARDFTLNLLGSEDAAVDDRYPDYLAFFIDGLLRERSFGEAKTWFASLQRWVDQRRASDDGQTASPDPDSRERWDYYLAALQAQLHAAQEESIQAIAVLNEYATASATDPEAKTVRLRRAADLLDQLKLSDAAADLRRAAVRQSDDPHEALRLARTLAKQGRWEEGLDICEKVRDNPKCSPHLLVIAIVAILQDSPTAPVQYLRVEPWLEEVMRTEEHTYELLTAMAAFRDVQKRYADVEALYKKILESYPDNVLAMNNSAWFLAVNSGQNAEALRMINQAIQQAGPNPTLLDTRATILLGMGETQQAIDDLNAAITRAPSASKYFHLALAYRQAGRGEEAKAAFEDAARHGLKEDAVHPLERQHFFELVAAFSQR